MTRKKLLFVVNDYGFFLSHRLELARAAARAGYEVSVAAGGIEDSKDSTDKEFPVYPIRFSRRGMNPLGECLTIFALYRLFVRLKPGIVHLVTIKPVVYGGIAANWARVPAVMFAITGLGYVFTSNRRRGTALRGIVRGLYRLAFRHPNFRVIFQNPDDLNDFIASGLLRGEQTVLIRGSGVDVGYFQAPPAPPGPSLIVFAGRFLRDKGIHEFVEAARLLRSQGISARFALVGSVDPGNPSCIADDWLESCRREGVVEVWGQTKDMLSVFQQAYCVCLPSYREGVPRVLIEAASCARPIVATDVPGCREIVINRKNGILVPPRDADALASALKEVVNDPELAQRMGQAGRELAVSEFSLERINHETIETYRQVEDSPL